VPTSYSQTSFGEPDLFDRLYDWILTLRKEGQYERGLTEVLLAVERVLTEMGEEALAEAVKTRLGFWYLLILAAEEVGTTVLGFLLRANAILVLLVASKDDEQFHSITKELDAIGPAPPPGFTPDLSLLDMGPDDISQSVNELAVVPVGVRLDVSILRQLQELLFQWRVRPKIFRSVEEDFLGPAPGSERARHSTDYSRTLRDDVRRLFNADALPKRSGLVSPAELIAFANVRAIRKHRDDIRNEASICWTITLKFLGTGRAAAEVGGLLMAVGGGLETIDDIIVDIDDAKTGSIVAGLKAYIMNSFKRDQVVKVLTTARDSVVAQSIGKPLAEVAKLEEEGKKIAAERASIERQAELMHSGLEAQEARDIELQRKRYELNMMELELREKQADIRKKELDNELLQLTVAMKISTLIREKILIADPVVMEINGSKYLIVSDGRAETGEDMKSIVLKETEIESNTVRGPTTRQDDAGRPDSDQRRGNELPPGA
jgi:hypothetical protein